MRLVRRGSGVQLQLAAPKCWVIQLCRSVGIYCVGLNLRVVRRAGGMRSVCDAVLTLIILPVSRWGCDLSD